MSIHNGHRQRMRNEFLANGLEGVPDHRALELLLCYAIPMEDVNPLAHTLIQQFGSLAGVFDATHEQLTAIQGIGEYTAVLIKLIPALCARYRQSRSRVDQLINDSRDICELFAPHFFGARNEMVYLACLDAKRKVLGVRKLGEGIVNAAEITGRKVVEAALALNSSVVILAHNHTSGIAAPSLEDVATTRYLYELLCKVGVELYDHVVIVEDDMVSLRDSGVFSSYGITSPGKRA
jgi:DNA repair protein RadC